LLKEDRRKLLQRRFAGFVLPEDMERWHKHFVPALRHDEKQTCEIVLKRNNGTVFPTFLDFRLVSATDAATKIRISLTDTTERKQAEVSACESEATFHRMFAHNESVMLLIDPDSGFIVDANAAAAHFYGYSVEHLKAMRIDQVNTLSFDEVTAKRRQASDHTCNIFEFHHRLASGEVRTVEVHSSPLAVGGSNLLFSIVYDITERKRLEADLIASKAEAEKANKDKSRFLAAASHDLRQPLLALSLYVGLLNNRNPSGKADLPAKIQECAASLNEMLTDLLDISKFDAGIMTPKLTDFDIDDLLGNLASIHSAEADLKGLTLCMRYSGIVARTDAHLLQRILGNLVANAIRYTDKGGVLMACRRHQGKCWVEVWDTGRGIPEDQTGIIFEEFRQLGDDSRNRGSGLGLSIVAKAAALLGLQIRVRSRSGRGSMFAIELPSGLRVEADELPTTHTPTRTLRIGLVEDNVMALDALVYSLEASGHEVIPAKTGRTLLERLEQRMPDVVISDYRLAEGETGFDVIAATRNIYGNDLPAILITGDTDPKVIRSMADRGIALLHKPLDIEAMLMCISEVAERRSSLNRPFAFAVRLPHDRRKGT